MRLSDSQIRIFILAGLIGATLLYIRGLASGFILGTTTFEHPYIQFAAALIFGGMIALAMIPVLKSTELAKRSLYLLMGLALLYRALFMSSIPIYEDDWNRYLWDGAVITQGVNPYKYSPVEVIEGFDHEEETVRRLHTYSLDTRHELADYGQERVKDRPVTRRINHPYLRTIYPPVAQGVFALAAFIDPINPDVLRGVYLFVEALTFFLLIKTLQAYGRDEKWALLYILNPLLIYSGFNVLHMDLLLMPPMLLTMLWIRQGAPMKAAAALAVASAVKLWPLLLAPILFRRWRGQLKLYIMIAVATAVMAMFFNLPLLLSIGEDSGLSAYTGEWQRSSFIFPIIFYFLEPFTNSPGQISRILVALTTTLVALYYGFIAKADDDKLPLALMITTGVLLFLSPTGYPWYLYWILIFLPFVPSYGLTLLSALVALYYVRYGMGERELYHIYENVLVPLQFGIPLLVISYELFRRRRAP